MVQIFQFDINKYELVVVDIDKTLVNLILDWELLKRNLQEKLDDYECPFSLKNGISALLLKLKYQDIYIFDQLNELISEYEISGFNHQKINYRLVNILYAYKGKLAILSMNTRKLVDRVINFLDLKVGLIQTREDIINLKPSPQSLLTISQYYSIDPLNCLFIADTKLDEQTAYNAKFNFFQITGENW